MSNEFYPPDTWEWDEEFAVYRDTVEATKTGVPYAYDENGERLVGFANPYYDKKYRNKTGRPKERNATALALAQDRIDGFANAGVRRMKLIAENKWEELGLDGPVPLKMQFEASKYLVDKAIANEKEKARIEAKAIKDNDAEMTTDEQEEFNAGVIVEFTPAKS